MNKKIYLLKSIETDPQGAPGNFKAVFSTMNIKDKDGDITLNGAFGNQKVIIGGYNHGSWDRGVNALPAGKGKIYENGNDAVVEGVFFIEGSSFDGKEFKSTMAGEETYKTVFNMTDQQEWSFSLPNIDFEYRQEDGERTRILKKIRVNEVAPVLMGAGEGTRTLDVKSQESIPLAEHMETVQAAVSGLVERIKNLGELRAGEGRHPSEDTMKRTAIFKAALADLCRELGEIQEKHFEPYRMHMEFMRDNAGRGN